MIIQDAPLYISDDGKREFRTAKECREYEVFTTLSEVHFKYAPHGSVYSEHTVNFIVECWNEIKSTLEGKQEDPRDKALKMAKEALEMYLIETDSNFQRKAIAAIEAITKGGV